MLFLSFTCEDIGVVMVTKIIFLVFIRILTFRNRKYKYYCLYFSFITLHLSFITFLWQAFCDRWTLWIALFCCFEKWIKKSCALRRNFISIYKINRTLHGHLGIQILSSSAESISHEWAKRTSERYFQHSKIKFVSPQGHVISSIYSEINFKDNFVHLLRRPKNCK